MGGLLSHLKWKGTGEQVVLAVAMPTSLPSGLQKERGEGCNLHVCQIEEQYMTPATSASWKKKSGVRHSLSKV